MKIIHSRLFRLIVAVGSIVSIIGLSRSIYTVVKKRDIVKERQRVLSNLEAQNRQLETQLEESLSPTFIEREAREKLGMAREGESVVIMDNGKWIMLAPSQVEGKNRKTEEKTAENVPNWKKWWRLFF